MLTAGSVRVLNIILVNISLTLYFMSQNRCNIQATQSSPPFPSPFPETPISLILGPSGARNFASSGDALLIYRNTLLQIVCSGMDVPCPSAFDPEHGPVWLNALVRHAETFMSRMDAWEADYSTFTGSL